MPAIRLENISKAFRIYPSQLDRMKEALSLGRMKRGHDFWALRDIDLEVEWGTSLGILGRNGAGKSTLLQVASGILAPTTGTAQVNGRIVFLQLGAGFNKEFTGRENVMLNGLTLGIDRKKMLERFDEIEAFAGLGEFMDQPMKTYSSGMKSRLGFAVAVNVEPDILVVDETLSVGDAVFKQSSIQKMLDLKDRGTTILFVSHSASMVRSFCSEAILMHEGKILSSGNTSDALDQYEALTSSIKAKKGPGSENAAYGTDEDEEQTPDFKENPDLEVRRSSLRQGTGEARISDVEILNDELEPTDSIVSGTETTVRVHLEYRDLVIGSKVNILLRNKAGLDIFSTSTSVRRSKREDSETRVIVDFTFDTPLQPGSYSINAAVSRPREKGVHLDQVNVAAAFNIVRPKGRGKVDGLLDIPSRTEVHRPDLEQRADRSA